MSHHHRPRVGSPGNTGITLILAASLAAAPALAGEGEAPRSPDLAQIRARGYLRVIVPGSGDEFLPRSGMPASYDKDLALELGARLGVEIRFVLVDSYDRLFPALLEGEGDVIAAQLTSTPERAAMVAFSKPTMTSAQIVVGRKGVEGLPRGPKELAGREVHVRASSAYARTLRTLAETEAPGLRLVDAPETLKTDELVEEVARGKRPLTVVDQHMLRAIQGYDPEVEALFPIASDLPISWALRKDNPELEAAVDGFLFEKALTKHTREVFDGDLEGIKERRVLRVLTRNNAISYFLHRGEQFGFDYELAKMFASELGVRLEMVVPPSRDLLIPWLVEGRGDLIAASLSPSPDRAELVAFTRPYMTVEQLLVRRKGKLRELRSPADLKGHVIHVRRSSVYWRTLEELRPAVGLELVEAPEELETEELIAQVAEGKIPLTVADSHILDAVRVIHPKVEPVFSLEHARARLSPPAGAPGAPPDAPGATAGAETGEEAEKTPVAFAVRKSSPELHRTLDDFVRRRYRGLEYNMLKKRYFENRAKLLVAQKEGAATSGRLSPYDGLIKKYAKKYGFDWRLLAAQAFQESRFDPKAESWVGAKGLFQVMPRTAAELGFRDVTQPEQGIEAGAKYMGRLLAMFDEKLELRQRVRFALASYNVGPGHVHDARRLARELGLDPNRWFHNVEKAMLLLEKPNYAAKAKSGYCRGSEAVNYVSRIQSSFDAYVKALPQ